MFQENFHRVAPTWWCFLLIEYVIVVAKRYGVKGALDLGATIAAQVGQRIANMLKERGIRGSDLKTVVKAYSIFLNTTGIEYEILSETKDKVTLKLGECPIIAACTRLSVPRSGFCKKICENTAVAFTKAFLREYSLKLKYEFKYRLSPDGFCEETIAYV